VCKSASKLANTFGDIRIFYFQNGGLHHLGFLEI